MLHCCKVWLPVANAVADSAGVAAFGSDGSVVSVDEDGAAGVDKKSPNAAADSAGVAGFGSDGSVVSVNEDGAAGNRGTIAFYIIPDSLLKDITI